MRLHRDAQLHDRAQLGRSKHERGLLRPRRSLWSAGLGRVLSAGGRPRQRTRARRDRRAGSLGHLALSRERAREGPALPQPSVDRALVRAQRGRAVAEVHGRSPRRDHGRARSASRLSAGLRRGARRAIRRPVLVATAGELLRRGPGRAAHAVQDRDRLRVDPDARSDLRDDAGRRRRALPQRRLGRARFRHRRRQQPQRAVPRDAGVALRRHLDARALRPRRADGQLRGVPRAVRRALRQAVQPVERRHHVDEQPGPAEPDVADLQLRPRAVRELLRGEKGVRVTAHPDESERLPRRGHQPRRDAARWADGPHTRDRTGRTTPSPTRPAMSAPPRRARRRTSARWSSPSNSLVCTS